MKELVGSDATVILAIAAAALATYALRLGGLLLADRLPQNGGFRRFMDTLPGTILLSLVAPGIASAGFLGAVAALATAFCAWRTRNVLLSMALGMAIVAGGRWIG